MNRFEKKFYNYSLIFNEAFLLLLDEKQFEEISITDLCLKAGLNRSTFYAHYQNMNDVLVETVKNTMDSSMADIDDDSIKLSDIKYFLNYVKNNQRLYKIYLLKLSSNPGINEEYLKLSQIINEVFIQNKISDNNEMKYRSAYYLGGIKNVVSLWLFNGCKEDIDSIYVYIKKSVLRIKE